MAEGDFEVMPRGTMEEVKAMRKFVTEISNLTHQFDDQIPTLLLEKIREMETFYIAHILKYNIKL